MLLPPPLRRALTDEGKFTTQIAPSYVENAQATGLCSRPLSEDELEAIDLLEEIGLQTCYGVCAGAHSVSCPLLPLLRVVWWE